MKYFLLFTICIVSIRSAYTQSCVVDFSSVITANTVDRKVCILDITYQNGKFDTIKKRVVKSRKLNKRYIKNDNDTIGHLINAAQLIDYKSDTLYVLSTYYMPTTSVSMTIKTRKESFNIVHNEDGVYSIRSLAESYTHTSEDTKESDELLYRAIFNWDVDLLIRLIKASGSLLGSEYFMSATRIILKDNQVLKKDIINFEPALRWQLE